MNQSNSNNSNEQESVKGITRISVSGYKSLYDECSIEVRPLVILSTVSIPTTWPCYLLNRNTVEGAGPAPLLHKIRKCCNMLNCLQQLCDRSCHLQRSLLLAYLLKLAQVLFLRKIFYGSYWFKSRRAKA
jgi:hypothetical protein